MNKENFNQHVYEGFSSALVAHSAKYIANEIGIKPGTLRAFKKSRNMRPENMGKLSDWLRNNGYLDKEYMSWRREIQKSSKIAISRDHREREIASEINVPLEAIFLFEKTGEGNIKLPIALAHWLGTNGYLRDLLLDPYIGFLYGHELDDIKPETEMDAQEKEHSTTATKLSATAGIAKDLRALADILDGEYPQEFKARKFSAWVKIAHENLSDLVSVVKKSKPD